MPAEPKPPKASLMRVVWRVPLIAALAWLGHVCCSWGFDGGTGGENAGVILVKLVGGGIGALSYCGAVLLAAVTVAPVQPVIRQAIRRVWGSADVYYDPR
jgi:hypothetical protein